MPSQLTPIARGAVLSVSVPCTVTVLVIEPAAVGAHVTVTMRGMPGVIVVVVAGDRLNGGEPPRRRRARRSHRDCHR